MKKKQLPEEKNRVWIIIFVLILVFLAVTIYLNFFYSKKCKDSECFNSALARCRKAEFQNKNSDATWLYRINGLSRGKCLVTVKNNWVKLDEAKPIEGKSMLCSLPKGVVMAPESDLNECHGLLKESLQDVIIERMHTYIVQNIGQISENFRQPV
jgi:hypothetical protein